MATVAHSWRPVALGGLLALAASWGSIAPARGPEDAEGRFSGFEAIAVGCTYRSQFPTLERLCEEVRARAGLAAARAGVRLLLAPDNDPDERRQQARDARAVILECELAIADPGEQGGRQAIHARLSLARDYSGAVDAGADGGIAATPRAGRLELWAQDIIASGRREDLVPAMAEAIERLARNAVETYVAGGGARAGE